MAKIVDIKTRKVLADLPSVKTERTAKVYIPEDISKLGGKIGIIALNVTQAKEILFKLNQFNKKAA
jgi:hypothetical protein